MNIQNKNPRPMNEDYNMVPRVSIFNVYKINYLYSFWCSFGAVYKFFISVSCTESPISQSLQQRIFFARFLSLSILLMENQLL